MWRSVNAPGIGFLSTIDAKLSEEQSAGRIKFPDLRRTDRLLIVSDYAGDHESSKFETYSYLILSRTAWMEWEARRRLIRQPIDLTKRRISCDHPEILAMISSNLLPHNLRHLRCGTTEIDDGTLNVEDLASIPDLIAGSAAVLHTRYSEQGVQLTSVIAPAPAALGWRAHAVLDWLADKRLPLTRAMLLIEPIAQGGKLSVMHVRVHGTTGLA